MVSGLPFQMKDAREVEEEVLQSEHRVHVSRPRYDHSAQTEEHDMENAYLDACREISGYPTCVAIALTGNPGSPTSPAFILKNLFAPAQRPHI